MTNTVTASSGRARFHEHALPFAHLAEELECTVTVGSIMVPWEKVRHVKAPGNSRQVRDEARALMDQYHYSAVPLVREGTVLGVYKRWDPQRTPNFEKLQGRGTVSPESSVIELLRHMRRTRRITMIVGTHQAPEGWVTFADFSKRPARLLFFAYVAEIEYLLASALDMAYPDDGWIDLLEEPTRNEIRKRQKDAAQWDGLMPATTFAHLNELVDALKQTEEARRILGGVRTDHLRSLRDFRNRVAHVVRPVIPAPGQIKWVADEVDRMLEWASKWPDSLSRTRKMEQAPRQ